MAEALVSPVVERLVSIIEEKVRLVVGVKKEVQKLTSNLTAIKAVLADAEIRQAKEATTVRDWLHKLKDITYDIEDLLDDWEAAIASSRSKPERKVCSFLRSFCFCYKQVCPRHHIASKIKELNGKLDEIAQQKDRYHFVQREGNPPIERPRTVSMIDVAEVTGREEKKSELVNKLLSEPSDGDGSNFRVLSIVGMGGIGKTTLAQCAFDDDRIKAEFDERIWVCVSDPFDETRVAKAILTLLPGPTQEVTEWEDLLRKIGESIKNKKFLLTLDDVWEENSKKWDQLKQPLKFGLPGSKVLVTTRKKSVALAMSCLRDNILLVKELLDEECWLIIRRIAFFGRSSVECELLEEIGKKIASKCKGLPLAAKVVGGILRIRETKEQWQYILTNEIWEIEEGDVIGDVIGALWLSYNDLSPQLKMCFSYCAIFSKDYYFYKDELIELWMAQGYLGQSDNLEIIGENYFQNLAVRSFFQEFTYASRQCCKMHDMVHDLAQIVGGNAFGGVKVNNGQPVRHLRVDSIEDCIDSTWFKSFNGTKKLRSLLIERFGWNELSLTTENLAKFFNESTHLRSLSVSWNDLEDIPPSIHKLVQLRWLHLCGNDKLKHLDEKLCELHSLHTINVSYCGTSMRLPHGIGKLIKLRHLHNHMGPSRLPKGIAELTGLRTLERVDVGCDDDEDAFSLGDLKNLNQLRGFLIIRGLGARDRHVGEAKQAELKKKEHITALHLWFSGDKEEGGGGEERCTPSNEELLLEALEPSPYLELLEIEGYRGATFPVWIISLTNLRSIMLSQCGSCEHLPSLGKLPSLETLWLSGVKKVGVEVSGIEESQMGESKNEISASASSSSVSSPPPVVVAAFPKLTTLQFYGMESWEEWDDYYDGTTKPPPAIQIMPSLCSLIIYGCSRLKALPDYILQNTTLQLLGFSGSCNLLKERYNKEIREKIGPKSLTSLISHFDDY